MRTLIAILFCTFNVVHSGGVDDVQGYVLMKKWDFNKAPTSGDSQLFGGSDDWLVDDEPENLCAGELLKCD